MKDRSWVWMMMTIKTRNISFALILLALFASGDLLGQQKDFLTWFEAEFKKGLNKKLDLSVEIEQRFKNNSLSYDRSLITLMTDYDFTDYFKAAGGVRALLTTDDKQNLHARYRLHLDATGSYPVWNIDLSLRIRLQYGIEDLGRIAYSSSNNLVNRYRIKAGYHIFGTRIGIFGSLESMHLLSGNPARNFYKMRYSAGAQYALNFQSEFSLRYILEDEFNVVNPLQSHILVFGYSLSL